MPKEPLHWYKALTPLSFLERIARVMPDKTAVIDADRQWTWNEFFTRVNQLSNALKGIGVKKGDKVTFLSRNFPPLLEAHYGIPLTGASIVAINYRLSASEIMTIVNLAEAKVMFVDAGVADRVNPKEMPQVKTYINVCDGKYYGETPRKELPGVDYEEFVGKASKDYVKLELEDENDLIAIDYTSGTTGKPKGCMYSHRSTYLHAITKIIEHSLNAYSVYLWSLPMFHCNGWCWTWATSGVGATNVCMPAPDASEMWRLVDKHKVTHMAGAPVLFYRLGQYMEEHGIKQFPNKVIINVAAAPPPEAMILDMEHKGAEIRHAYGLTETYGPFTICEWQPKWDALPVKERISIKMRQGVPDITAGEMRVVDAKGKDVPWDGKTMGEIIMRGNDVVQGYYKAPEENAKAFKGGWMYTGDGGVMHSDGYVEIKDRFKDLIISGGENIIGVEVENCIYQHPDVDEVVCYGKPDEKWGEVVKCLVHPKPGTNPTAEEIINFCRQRMAHFKCPKEIEFGEIPRTSAGKVQKHLLRQKEREVRGKERHTKNSRREEM
ncbi:Long-chain-fatty-acid--CoA ligase [subsurface metagenome]